MNKWIKKIIIFVFGAIWFVTGLMHGAIPDLLESLVGFIFGFLSSSARRPRPQLRRVRSGMNCG